ncbi:asparaginase [Aestuariivirga sp.]|uniref:asparaginase n=1 Tax=Aestuariivirga sp. TaxID=2650926 RepID=UPI0039E246F6
MPNPVIAEVTRGGIVESRHTGAFAVVNADGQIVSAAGDIGSAVFPRSAVKAFQCLPVIESGAADHFGLTDEEIALACSSHNGEPEHVRVARAMLAKCGNSEEDYECGAHWPIDSVAEHAAVRASDAPLQVHNNCSGKHAGMLALARQLGAERHDYVKPGHPVQQAIAETMGALCGCDLAQQPVGIDGCSVPTWAIPLRNLALGFARLPSRPAGQRIIAAVRAHPFMVAGTKRFDTDLMETVPRAFVKTGAEGVYCGAIPHAGLGIALKCDDGAGRAAEVAMAHLLASLDVWTPDEREALEAFSRKHLRNWRKLDVGEVRWPAP